MNTQKDRDVLELEFDIVKESVQLTSAEIVNFIYKDVLEKHII